ncbi:CobQ/CobB/MinD/ParA nucleotide binding domain protein [Streptomyces turgidiscabies Car8]|uniref:CobQ/CobB/MinD/ParA nucleotide binding domain protein n=1 Tax=Streptomyces turgidiscabies (strain Car8) TaxID=698760 RepID=L7EVM3_STRT8|nr:CobQ/CobB/MinD/ParA nucleotide binding domain protein [Streptomyces turgidiscabies Car8]GAQ77211.1 chromosome partitioning protein ParA [Streptomyces turgidiscabies]
MSVTQAQTVPIPPLSGYSWHLPTVASWEEPIEWVKWRAQLRVPSSFQPLRPGTTVRTIAVANQKGGVGKTTTVAELGAAAAARDWVVRVIGVDPQKAGLSAWLKPIYPEGLDPKRRRSLTHVFHKTCTLDEATYPTRFKGLYVVPAGSKLGGVEKDGDLVGRELTIARGIQSSSLDIDLNLLDCGPTLGTLTVAALVAADAVIIPTEAGKMETLGVGDVYNTIRKVQEAYNAKLYVMALILTEWARSAVMKATAIQLATDFPDAVIAPVRPSVKVKEAVGEEKPTRLHAPKDSATRDFDQIAGVLFGDREAS